jgi:uncharacterized protein
MTTQAPTGWSREELPFHAGESLVQERAGVRDRAETSGRKVIREYMPEQHREFFAQLPFILAGSVDESGQPWASILVGRPGFVHSPDPQTLRIDGRPLPGDPLAANLHKDCAIGLLGIELPTRRRNRMNGIVSEVDDTGMTVNVRLSFGNCPKYIQTRECHVIEQKDDLQVTKDVLLDEAAQRMLASADTFFIATANLHESGPASGVDVSHRGGPVGFVRIDDEATLTFPDFAGNNFFNTLGNLASDPRAGLLFIDFENGDLLYLACRAEIIWEGEELQAFAGAQRLVRLRVVQSIRVTGSLPLRWSEPGYSPNLAGLGTWPSAVNGVRGEMI